MKGGIPGAVLVAGWLAASVASAADSATYTHDANGNLTSRIEDGVEWAYAYDPRDLLREVRRDGAILEAYQYDADGRRVRKTSAEGVVRYVWDGDRIVEETDDFGNTIAKYQYVGDRILSVGHVAEGTGYYLLDTLGSPVALVRADGTLAARYRVDAWGVLRAEEGSFPNPFRFTGHQFDHVTGLYYAKARYYEPTTGRFLSEDPFEGGAAEPQSLHRYLYAYANPAAFVDRDGRCAGALQQTEPCQAIARGMAYIIGGDPEAEVEREIDRRQKVVQGRREFREQMGRDPLPHEVVWAEGGRALTSSFRELDMTGRVEADHAEWALVGAGVGTRIAVGSARAAGASTVEQTLVGVAHLGDEAVSQVVGVSPGDAGDIARLARQGLAPRPPPGWAITPDVTIVGESTTRPGADLLRLTASPRPSSIAEHGPPRSRDERYLPDETPAEQSRDAIGRFLAKSRPEQRPPGFSAVDDFISEAKANGFDIVGREVSVTTPFGLRRYDVVLRDVRTGSTHGIEIKSSQEAFDRFDQPARQQFAADRWVNSMGATAVGKNRGLVVDDATKILWALP